MGADSVLPDSRLTLRQGEGHFALWWHLEEMLRELLAA